MADQIRIALAGNPNSGKTTIFNRITGAHQHVANYPGVTVDLKKGRTKIDGTRAEIIDLPGTYSLTALSEEELVARNYILNEKPDVVIDILDASTLERQLYLAVQLLELNVPLILAFNMTDVAEKAGFEFDLPLLSDLLGVPIVQTTGLTGEGIDDLLKAASELADGIIKSEPKPLVYGKELDRAINNIARALEGTKTGYGEDVPLKWIAIKLLESDDQVLEQFEKTGGMSENVATVLLDATKRLAQLYPDPPHILIAEARYGIISGAASETVTHSVERRHDFSDRLDTIFINPLFGLPIFLALMYLVFYITFTLGNPLMSLMEVGIESLGTGVSGWFPEGTESPIRSLLVDGIINGVGGVLVFLPNILLLFLAIAILEDTGYMARAAFIMDRLMHRIGLHGKSFIPMLIGFGCSVPAIMGTRILENRRDRLVTILVIPLMSCGARLPIYALIIPAFFPPHLQGPMLWLIYFIGILLAIVLTKLLRSTVFKGESTPFVMELPPYRIPTLQALMVHAWDRGKGYLQKAGTVILAISILMWFATSYPKTQVYSEDYISQIETLEQTFRREIVDMTDEFDGGLGTTTIDELVYLLDEVSTSDISVYPHSRTTDLDDLVFTVWNVQRIRSEVSDDLEAGGLVPGSEEYIRGEAELLDVEPEMIDMAVYYLDTVHEPFVTGTDEIDNAMAREELENSAMGRISRAMIPFWRPMGFDWKIGTASLGAMAAKEVFVAQMGIVYSIGETDEESTTLRSKLQDKYTPLTGLCIMLFMLIASPCVATLAITKSETGGWKWAAFQFLGLTAIGWAITTLVYQVSSLFGWGI